MLYPKTNLSAYSEYVGLGIQIAASMVVPLLGGLWLDGKLETSPWFTMAGAFFGIASIFVIIWKIAIIANRKSGSPKSDDKK